MVRRVTAHAELDVRAQAGRVARRQAAAGDVDNVWLVEQWREGRVLLAHVTVQVHAEDEQGRVVAVARDVEEVWLDRAAPPVVEQQIAEVAPVELDNLARDLRAGGVHIDDEELEAPYLHVVLGDRLRAALDQR